MATTTPPTVEPAPPPKAAPARTPVPAGRTTMPAGRVMVVILVALVTWTVLYAPSLKRSSEAQPLGTRRTVSLAVLRPIAAISSAIQLARVTDAVSRALGNDPTAAPGGGPPPDVLPVDTGPHNKPPTPPKKTDAIRVPTSQHPLRVAVVGDSLAAGLGVFAERAMSPALTRVSKQGRISTGLSRLDYFDWLGEMQHIMNVFDPDLVIVMVGVQDNQSLESPQAQQVAQIGTPAWPPAYEARVKQFARIAVNGGAHVVWVGLPVVQNRGRWELFQRQNGIFQEVADEVPNTVYVDTWDRFSAPGGGYTAYYRNNNGQVQLIRESDGIHFNGTGYDMVAHEAIEAAIAKFKLTDRVLANG
jgi:uncharacterized protein